MPITRVQDLNESLNSQRKELYQQDVGVSNCHKKSSSVYKQYNNELFETQDVVPIKTEEDDFSYQEHEGAVDLDDIEGYQYDYGDGGYTQDSGEFYHSGQYIV